MDQVDGHAAAQGLVGTVHRAVIHPRPPVRQVGGTDHPAHCKGAGRAVIFQRQHGAAPAHGCATYGFCPGGQQGGKVYIRLLGGNNGLFDKQRVCQAANFLQCLRVQAGGVGDKRQIVVRQGGGILQGGELAVQQLRRAGAQRGGLNHCAAHQPAAPARAVRRSPSDFSNAGPDGPQTVNGSQAGDPLLVRR